MKVSIVTISFNQAQFIEQAILSVLNQNYKNIEYIIVDPGSTDGSREIIEHYRDKIDRIIFEPDKGPADGLNKGFAVATGDVFGFLNSDDYFLPGALAQIASSFHKFPNKDVISGNALVVDEECTEINRFYSRRFSLSMRAYGASVLAQQSTFFRASKFKLAGGFNINNRIAWDGELWVDLALAGAKFGRISNFLSAFRVYEGSITGSGAHLDEYNNYLDRMFEKTIGRNERPLDNGVRLLAKTLEYATHPKVLLQRLRRGPVIRNKNS